MRYKSYGMGWKAGTDWLDTNEFEIMLHIRSVDVARWARLKREQQQQKAKGKASLAHQKLSRGNGPVKRAAHNRAKVPLERRRLLGSTWVRRSNGVGHCL